MTGATLDVIELGRRPYRELLELQREFRLARIDGALTNDILLLVEHDPVYTMGRGTLTSSLPVSVAALRAHGADVVAIERGGDVTWHGPGQLVGYPIMDLSRHREDLHWYLRSLEQALIDALAALGLPSERVPGKTGVWTGGRKIASIGIHVKQWVTLHGFALNINPDLSWFEHIVPCGIAGVVMTSIERELGLIEPAGSLASRVHQAVVSSFGQTFSLTPRILPAEEIPGRLAMAPGSRRPSPHG
jgi:lipoyl(octanoyl) transferase